MPILPILPTAYILPTLLHILLPTAYYVYCLYGILLLTAAYFLLPAYCRVLMLPAAACEFLYCCISILPWREVLPTAYDCCLLPTAAYTACLLPATCCLLPIDACCLALAARYTTTSYTYCTSYVTSHLLLSST